MIKLKHMKNKNNQGGFIRFIVILIIILVIGQILGYGPLEMFTKVIWPVVIMGWHLILAIVDLLVDFLRQVYTAVVK